MRGRDLARADLLDQAGVWHLSGVAAEHAVDVCPDLEVVRTEERSDERPRRVAASTAWRRTRVSVKTERANALVFSFPPDVYKSVWSWQKTPV